jgi:hypothetical protein
MMIRRGSMLCAMALGLTLAPAATAAPASEASLTTVARFLARTAIFFQIGTGLAEASARGSATVDPLSIKLEAAYPGVGEAVILAAMADAHAIGDQFTRSSMIAAQDKLRPRLKPGQVRQLAVIVQPIVTYLDQRLAEATAESGTPKAALLTSGYGVAIEESEKRSSQLTRQKGGRATLDILRALRHSLAAGQAAGVPGLACHAARAGRTAGAAYLRGQGAPAAIIAEFSGQPASPAIPFDRACTNGSTTMPPDRDQPRGS